MDREQAVAQWYQCGLSNAEAKQLIGHIPGVLAYGTLKSYQLLPERAKDMIRTAYDSEREAASSHTIFEIKY